MYCIFSGVSSGTVNLFPHQGKTVMVHPEHVGSGAFFCAVIDHLEGGMTAIYNVCISSALL